MKARTYLSLGSNLGDRRRYLEQAVEELQAAGLEVIRVSSFYQTEPVGGVAQDWFLNCAVQGETELPPLALLRRLQEIEGKLGRRREMAGGPRTVDLDLLLYEDQVMNSPELALPHPRLAERRFVLEPLSEIAPQARHPLSGRTMAELLAALPDRSRVEKLP
jgi:2-amino-4-hydroxy-6-hydroxymethyldihydropteridine diphosphokinase